MKGGGSPRARVTASGSETQRLFSDLTNRRPIAFQFARMPCLEFSELVLNHWTYIALFAGIGMLASLVCPWLLPIAMFVAASVVAFSTNLIPGERYIAVMEPLYYILGVAGVYSLWTVATYKSRRPESR